MTGGKGAILSVVNYVLTELGDVMVWMCEQSHVFYYYAFTEK